MQLSEAASVLRTGKHVTLRPSGHSMTPIIHHKQEVTLAPLGQREIQIGDVVLVKLRGRWLLHKVSKRRGEQYQITNARGHVNGWATKQAVAGYWVGNTAQLSP